MKKRYQVFVSSTYSDLIPEREKVMETLLKMECMPAGMELFPAANESQWDWIKKVIDESDYYIIIVAGRYGSLHPEKNISYTELEYNYAMEIGKPVLRFINKHYNSLPNEKLEDDELKREKLNSFVNTLLNEHLCSLFTSPEDLMLQVYDSISKLMKSNPTTGWMKAETRDGKNNKEDILAAYPKLIDSPFLQEIASCKDEIKILQTWIGNYDTIEDSLKRALKRNVDIKILLLNPKSMQSECRRKDIDLEYEGDVSKKIEDNISSIKRIARQAKYPNCIELRLYDATPIMSLYSCDNIYYMGLFWRKEKSAQTSQLRIMPLNSLYHRRIQLHFDDLWNDDNSTQKVDLRKK